ncbi:unnamed protein product [Linum tenue]|uniref:Exostosin GT47 domain-containing protein n=1 Tax=Linum tenue TaxID=586396 RepID=A0AAV0H7G9_9ROSI|nr:unnamed protein product [Linum tenue]
MSHELQISKYEKEEIGRALIRPPKMYGKVILSVVFLLLLAFSYSIFIGSLDFRPYFFPLLPEQKQQRSQSCDYEPLKVYMYDLPRRFHVGMMDPEGPQGEEPVTAENIPQWPENAGVRKQHSVEYWLMASLLFEGRGREAVRVLDPEVADAFYVPFFSSLSFNTHGHNMTDPATEGDRKLQVEIMDMLHKSKYWQRSAGRDHVIPMTHPNAFRFLRQELNASILIVVDFGRYPRSLSTLSKDIVAPYVHVVDSYTNDTAKDPYESRKTLLFFRGSTVRKDSTEGMRSSKFCLHPAGDTPSSCRLFDAIVSHCVPVVVSDKIELPYEDEIDYTKFSLFFSDTEALQPGFLINKLSEFPKEKWLEMWRNLKNISHHFEFQFPPAKGDAVDMLWRQLRRKLPGVQLATHRRHRLRVPDWWRRR